MKLLLAFIIAAGWCGAARADWESAILPKSFQSEGSLPKALEVAQASGRSVIVYYTRTNCPPCNVLQSRLRDPSIGAPFAQDFVFTAV